MRRPRFLLGIFFTLVIFALGWQLGMQFQQTRAIKEQQAFEERFGLTGSGVTFTEDPEKEVDMSLLWTVWRLLDRSYVDPKSLTVDKLRFGAVKGLVEGVEDPYSAFMTPQESGEFQDVLSGTLEGIGAELTPKDGHIVVVAPLKKSPAAQAGLLPQDIILKVDDVSIEDKSLQATVKLIRGPRGTSVRLTVMRPSTSEELEMTILREAITVPSVEGELIETASGTVAHLSLNQFGDHTTAEAREILRSWQGMALSGIVLDLRSNGGGYLEGAIEIASFFLSQGKIVSVERPGKELESHFAFGDPMFPDLPMVVLINGGSASASEITAGALQDQKRAFVMGEQSFGKGTVQEVIELPGGSSLRVTVARWRTPSGKDLSKGGVTPDQVVPFDAKAFAEGVDTQKDAAAGYLLDR